MTIVQDTIGEIVMKFFKFIIIYALFLFLIAIIPLRILANRSELFSCHFITGINYIIPTTQTECIGQGGVWLDIQNFNNIFSSIGLIYQLVST